MDASTIGTPFLWGGFVLFILAMLALDLGVFQRKPHAVPLSEALWWTVTWVALALLFNLGVYHWFGAERALEFLTGYVIEKALSVDNIFVFLVIFSSFAVPPVLQRRVLLWGIVGALVMRAACIMLGSALLQSFHWIIYLFGGFLVYTGWKLLCERNRPAEPERNPLFLLFRRFVPSTEDYHGSHFVVVRNGRRLATPLLLVLVAIEASDIVFAVDSIPAVFAITHDPFIVFTSNIFAILGLRAMYFALAGVITRFHRLKMGLSLVLLFVGVKMLLADIYKLPVVVSLLIIVVLLGGSVVASVLWPPASGSVEEDRSGLSNEPMSVKVQAP